MEFPVPIGLKINPPVFKELQCPQKVTVRAHKCPDPVTNHPAISFQRLPQVRKAATSQHSSLSHLTWGCETLDSRIPPFRNVCSLESWSPNKSNCVRFRFNRYYLCARWFIYFGLFFKTTDQVWHHHSHFIENETAQSSETSCHKLPN